MRDFSSFEAVLLDLDGTLYHGEQPLPGAIELLRLLQQSRQPFACLTNSTMSEKAVLERLARMGVVLSPKQVYTAANAACDYVLGRFGGAARRTAVFNLATNAPPEVLGDSVTWVHEIGEPCDAIIVGAPANEFAGVDRQRIALQLAREGALIVGMCADRVYPSPRGIEFGAGALTTMLAFAAGRTPVFCGKPEAVFFIELCQRLGVDPARCVLIGDNLESDVGGAKRVGMRTIVTLTGVARLRELDVLPDDAKPDEVVENLTVLLK